MSFGHGETDDQARTFRVESAQMSVGEQVERRTKFSSIFAACVIEIRDCVGFGKNKNVSRNFIGLPSGSVSPRGADV